MALTADTAISGLTAVKVQAITAVGDIANTDEGSATVAALLLESTNFLITWARGQGKDPSAITNETDLLHAAAYWVVRQVYGGREGEEARAAFERFDLELTAELKRVVIETNDELPTRAGTREPVFYNHESRSYADPRWGPDETIPIYRTGY